MYEVLFILGAVLLIGFLAEYLFQKTKISSVVILMFIGLLLGPVFHIFDVESLRDAANIIGAITLTAILFDAGSNINLRKLIHNLPKASLFTLLNFTLTVLFIGLVLHFVFSWNWYYALILGTAVGGVSSPIVLSFIRQLDISENAKTALTLESTLTDVLCIITTLTLIQMVQNNPQSYNFTSVVASMFSVSIIYGVVAAIIWLFVLQKLKGEAYQFSITLGVLFILYYLTEESGGSGPIAVFIVGLILGHLNEISKWINIGDINLKRDFFKTQEEVTFFVRTYFFVYLGLLISIHDISPMVFGIGLLTILLTIIARFISTNLLFPKESDYTKKVMISMIPRGLAAAVLASLPFTYNLDIPKYFETVVFLVILISNLIASGWVYKIEKDTSKPKSKSNGKSRTHKSPKK